MSAIEIRGVEPTLAEAKTLLDVERQSLGDSDYTPVQALAILRRPEHHAYLAYRGDEPAGFCSCFGTPLSAGGWRLEIDMLGVRPAHQGRGVATALIAQSVAHGRLRGARAFRGVVAQDNPASQRAFAKAGFTVTSQVEMLVHELDARRAAPLQAGWTIQTLTSNSLEHAGQQWSTRGEGHAIHALVDAANARLALAETLQVHTLAYVGLWVERLWAATQAAERAMARYLVAQAQALECDEVGYLASVEEHRQGAPEALLLEGYLNVGRYLVLTS